MAVAFGSWALFYQSPQSPRDKIIQENIEALGSYESMGTMADSRCPGQAKYATAGVSDVAKIVRTHKSDTIDFCEIYRVKKCVAYDRGPLEGNNDVILDVNLISASDEECKGSLNHGIRWEPLF